MNYMYSSCCFVMILILIVFIIFCCISLKTRFINEVDFFHNNGYLVIPNVLNDDEVDDFNNLINDEVKDGDDKKEYGKITLNRKRKFDLNLEIVEPTKSIVKKIIYKRLKPLVESCGSNPIILDYSVLLNAPFSDPQPWHRDVHKEDIHNNGSYFFVGVAISDITNDMGGLEVVPKSNDKEYGDEITLQLDQIECHKNFEHVEGHFNNNNVKYKRITCPKGSLVLWDSTVVHRSGMNMSRNMRKMFYFSLLFKTHKKPDGGTNSLKNKYKQQHPLHMETL